MRCNKQPYNCNSIKMYQNDVKNQSSTLNSHQLESTSSKSLTNSDHHYSTNCDTNDSKEYTNGFNAINGKQSSPLRSQLGLNLQKSHTPASNTNNSTNISQVRNFIFHLTLINLHYLFGF